MARLAIPVSLLAALLFLALNVSAYKTTITTVEVDDVKRPGSGQGRCTQKLQSANPRKCERYVMEKCCEQDVIALRWIRTNRNENLEECCEQLRELNDPKCQCQELMWIMQRKGAQLEGREMRQLRRELQNLPEKCELELPSCDLDGVDF